MVQPHVGWACPPCFALHQSCTQLKEKERKILPWKTLGSHFRQRPKAWLQGDGEISNIKHGMSNARRGHIQYQQIAKTVEYMGGSRQTINNTQHATALACSYFTTVSSETN
jgi:hypothetical protein